MPASDIAKLMVSGRNEPAGRSWRDDAQACHLPRIPLPGGDHQPCCLALPRLQPELAGRRVDPSRAQHRHHAREHPAVVPAFRGRLRPQAPPATAEAVRAVGLAAVYEEQPIGPILKPRVECGLPNLVIETLRAARPILRTDRDHASPQRALGWDWLGADQLVKAFEQCDGVQAQRDGLGPECVSNARPNLSGRHGATRVPTGMHILIRRPT